jgi:hypothetical protein
VTDRGRDKAWITSTFIMYDGLRIARPSGIVRLTLHAVRPKSALRPVGEACWNLLCEMLGDGSAPKSTFPPGAGTGSRAQ